MMIVGLPRSRTAWLSVFMSQSKTYFHHEAINGCYSMDDYRAKTKGCGDSTTGFIPLLNEIKSKKTVIIKKNDEQINACIKWCDSQYKADSREFILDMDLQLSCMEGLVINQSDINDALPDIWNHLVDDDWDDKYTNLTKLNIQVNSTEINNQAARAFYATLQ